MTLRIQNKAGQVVWTGEGVNLRGADLREVDLREAILWGVDLTRARLAGADLTGADLKWTRLRWADLTDANLTDANLTDADLTGAHLEGAKLTGHHLLCAQLCIVSEGALVGWKKCRDGVVVKLRIPEDAPRSNAAGRKCRAAWVEVLEVFGADVGVSRFDDQTVYRVGEVVRADHWEADRWIECGGGIHFFLTREEADAQKV